MHTSHESQDRLVIEKRTPDGGCILVAQWGDTPKGYTFLSDEMTRLAKSGDGVYCVRHAQPDDDLRSVPSILRRLKQE